MNTPTLWPTQQRTLEHAWSTLQHHRGVILTSPLGAGKTFIACALALRAHQTLQLRVHLLAPARLLPMWHRIAASFQLPIAASFSHRRASMHALPAPSPNTLWLVDEAHAFRNPNTLRYRALARVVAPAYVCLITATPLNTSWDDVRHLLHLFGALPHTPTPHPHILARAFAHHSAGGPHLDTPPTQVRETFIPYPLTPCHCLPSLRTAFHILCTCSWPLLGEGTHTQALLEDLLMVRWVSHPNALLHTLRRIRRYYQRCRGPQGQLLDRNTFRRLFGHDGPWQALLPFAWPTAQTASTDTEHARQALCAALSNMIAALQSATTTDDTKSMALDTWLRTHLGEPQRHGTCVMPRAVVFTSFADTAAVVAQHLTASWSVGLITGRGARLHGGRVSPQRLLATFDPDATQAPLPCQVLVCTDVLGQGHNLQRAAHLVHLDRPWNPVRMRQREGRLCRPGQRATCVTLATMRPDTSWDRLQAHLQRLERALQHRTHAAHALRHASTSEHSVSSAHGMCCEHARMLLERLLNACRRVRRHPRCSVWLHAMTMWRRRLSGNLAAGVVLAIDDALASWPDTQDVDRLLVHVHERLSRVLPET